MEISADARKLLETLKRFKPKGSRRGMHEAYVRASAGGGMLILMGSFENSASLQVDVAKPGSAELPLESTLQLLKIHSAKEPIRIRAEAGVIWVGQVRFPSRATE